MSTTTSTKPKRITIDIASDELEASIKLASGTTDEPMTEEEVVAALAEAKVVVDDAVKGRVAEFVALVTGDQPPSEPFVVAKGHPADDGKEEEFVWDEAFERHMADWQGDTPVNYYTLNSIITVDEGVTIGTISPLVPAREGITVKGKAIKPGHKPTHLELDKSVSHAPENPAQIISNIAGRVVERGRKLMIEEVLKIAGDVSFATGNVEATTDVHITGAIPDRFEVSSAKSITVGATIEAAIVQAKGNVVVRGGIVGRKAGAVSADGQIIAKFCTEADLTAEGDVMIGKQLMNSRVRTSGRLIAEHSAVVGGHTYATQEVHASVLGSDSDTPTRVFVGTHPNVLEECAAIDEWLQSTRDAVRSIREKVQPLMDNLKRLAPAQREQATELMYKADEAEAKVAEEENRRNRILEEAGGGGNPRVRVSSIIHPKVVISLGMRLVDFQDELKGPVVIEERQIKNVTEAVAVNQLTGSVQIQRSRRLDLNELMRDFEPLRAPVGANTGE